MYDAYVIYIMYLRIYVSEHSATDINLKIIFRLKAIISEHRLDLHTLRCVSISSEYHHK